MDVTSGFSDMLGTLQTVGYFLVAVMIIVAVHEFGHYIVGRLCGIHAVTFSLGFGPALIRKRDRHGTLWQISVLPLGGFVKFLGDGDSASARADGRTMAALSTEEKRHTLHGAPLWARMLTVLAGPLANGVLTVALLAGTILWNGMALDPIVVGRMHDLPGVAHGLQAGDRIVGVAGQATPDLESYFAVTKALPATATVTYTVERGGTRVEVVNSSPMPPLVQEVQARSAARDAGILAGDVVTALDGAPITTFNQMPAIVQSKNGAPMTVTILRDGKTFDVKLSPRRRDLPDGNGGFETRWLIGLTSGLLFEPATRTPGPLETAQLALASTWDLLATNVSGIRQMLSGTISTCNLSGPIGMAEAVGQAARAGLDAFVQTLAILSLAIGLANLLPIPVLDGGHLVFHLYEVIMRRPPSMRSMQLLTTLGMLVVLGLVVFALTRDLTCT